ncbi:uncharacterized protein B0P05DRAFT_525752 [Gilbertella persicaria]|uniref:uncharacterized protein n=1 Tax=Gilbertella persicaria TaxID=101096 RepID=UPI00221EB320|nr:uncharacterized protein B0P05DRAFT_525752 [Gilbertella persicaria]KAI8092307.1 hypothetical protein B0P05DRAFT_525752 [Gilbertella persicaria]
MSKDSHIDWESSHFDSNSVRNVDENQKRTSWCLNDANEQQLRQELIQRATARLRRRMLEQDLQDVMRQVVSLQTQLETLHLETATTIDTVSDILEEPKTAEGTQRMNRQMDILERRLESHKLGLFQLQHTPTDVSNEAKVESNGTPMSRLSSLSLMSSIFGRSSASSQTSISDTCSIKKEDLLHESLDALEDDDNISHIESITHADWQQKSALEDDHPFYDLAGKRSFRAGSFCGSVYHDNQQELPPVVLPVQGRNAAEIRLRRRQRRQRHRQNLEQQQQQHNDTDSVISEDLSSVSSLSNIASYHYTNDVFLRHPLSPATPLPPHCTGSFFENSMQSWLSDDLHKKESWMYESIYPQRNVLDEAMSFLDGLGENDDDGGFEQDIYLLLQNPELCGRPLSEIETTMKELRLQENQNASINLADVIQLLKPSTWYRLGIKYSNDFVYQATCSGLQWCRFLSVLAAAVVISILKGPEDIRRHSNTRAC